MKMLKKIKIPEYQLVIDDREIKSGILEHLKTSKTFNLSVTRMPIADYCIDGNLWIERKTTSDLLISISDGRLFEQSYKLKQCNGHRAIVLEGTKIDLKNSDFNWNAIQGALTMVCVFWGIPLLRSRNIEETAKLLSILAKQNRQLYFPTRYKPIVYSKQQTKRQSQLALLCSIPGLGRKKAQALLEHFSSIHGILDAPQEDLQQVSGIGPVIAKQIHYVVKEESGQYNGNLFL